MSRRTIGFANLAVLLIAGLGVGGYFVGESEAPSPADADQERAASYEDARQSALRQTSRASAKRGESEGLAEGQARGEQVGAEAGKRAGDAAAGEELAAIEAQEEAAG